MGPLPLDDPWALDVRRSSAPRGRNGTAARWALVALLAATGPLVRAWPRPGWGLTVAVGGSVAAFTASGIAARRFGVSPVVRLVGIALLAAAMPTPVRGAVALVMAVAVVAEGALLGWGAAARRGGPPPIAATALAPLVLSVLTWSRRGEAAMSIALVVIGAIVVGVHHRFPEVMDRGERSLARLIALVGAGVSTALLAPVSVVFVYLPGSIGRLGRAVIRRRSPHGWLVREVAERDELRCARLPFAPPPPADRRRRRVIAAAVVSALVLAVPLQSSLRRGTTAVADDGPLVTGSVVRFSDLPSYRGVAFADELQEDQRAYSAGLRPVDEGGLENPTYRGPHTNVVDGVRRSRSPTCECPQVRVWLVGGSAAFGLGQRDEATIASELVRLAEGAGIALEIENLAVPGRTLFDEYRATAARLARPDVTPPQLIISYGGYNDAVGALVGAAAGRVDPDEPNRFESALVVEWAAGGFAAPTAIGTDELVDLTVSRYVAVRAQMDALARSFDIETAYVLHPDALASPGQFAPVADVYGPVPEAAVTQLRVQLEGMGGSLEGATWNLRDLFDETAESVFVDWAHSNERGARLVAEELYSLLAPELERLAR